VRPSQTTLRRLRILLVASVAVTGLLVALGGSVAGSQDKLVDAARQATSKYHDLKKATDDGFGAFYVCTDLDPANAMAQHFVNGARVGDPSLSETAPEVLVYQPLRNGGYRLAGGA